MPLPSTQEGENPPSQLAGSEAKAEKKYHPSHPAEGCWSGGQVSEAEQFPKTQLPLPALPCQSSDPSAGLARQLRLIGGFHLQPFSHLGSLKGRDPKSTKPCIRTAPNPCRDEPLPSIAPLGWAAVPGGERWPRHPWPLCCRRAAPLPAGPGLAEPRLHPSLSRRWAGAGLQQLRPQLPSSPCSAPASQGAVKAPLWGRRSRRGGGRREARRREEAALLLSEKHRGRGGETATFLPSQLLFLTSSPAGGHVFT